MKHNISGGIWESLLLEASQIISSRFENHWGREEEGRGVCGLVSFQADWQWPPWSSVPTLGHLLLWSGLSWVANSSVQFSSSVVSDSLQPHGLKHPRLPCPSPTPRAYSNPCPSSWWCHPTISSSVVPFSSCLPSFPASGSFPMSQFFASGGQSIEASAWVLPINIQDSFPLELTGSISLQSKGLSRVFSNTTVQKHQFFGTQPSLWSNSHIHTWLLEKP